MIDRLRELLRALGPLPWVMTVTEDGAALTAKFERPGDAVLIVETVNALPELLDAHDRMAGALAELIRTTDAYGEAQASRGHEGTPHDLYFHSAFSHAGDPATCLTVDDCSACMSAMYGTEAEMQMSIEAARAALAVPKEENPE
jgi:hypothetical protein